MDSVRVVTPVTEHDYYEVLQVSPSAEPETIHRVYRLLAQRYHPDNQQSGNAERFRILHEAYTVLNEPERRARYDITYAEKNQQRWRLAAAPTQIETTTSWSRSFASRCSRSCARNGELTHRVLACSSPILKP